VPGDLAAAVDVDHRRAVERPLGCLGALARRVDGIVLEKDDGVWRPPVDDSRVQGTLLLEGVEVRHGVGA